MRRRLAALVLAVVGFAPLALPSRAHPLGNFTTNVHLGIDIAGDQLSALVVVDMAEIPTFREQLDIDGDGDATPDELDAYALRACADYPDAIGLTAGTGYDLMLEPDSGVADLLAGSGGLSTLRVECSYSATIPGGASTISVSNRVHNDRSGWAEIVVSGARAEGAGSISLSDTLTSYPDSTPLAQRQATITIGAEPASAGAVVETPTSAVTGALGALAEGGGMLAIIGALGLGATHALAPGHGKTLMAAYLVGRRGTAVQAAGLGLATAVSHTIGVAVLGIVTATASSQFRPEAVYPWLTTISAIAVTSVGAVLLVRAVTGRTHRHDHEHGHDHHHHHEAHRHEAERQIDGWRSLAALGLAGGLVPSASAVVLLLGALAIGRPWFGLLLVAAFGVGMSVALVTVGIAALKISETGLRRLGRNRRLTIRPQLISAAAGSAVMALGAVLLWDAATTLLT